MGAIAGAFVGYEIRHRLVKSFGLPDFGVAAAEDKQSDAAVKPAVHGDSTQRVRSIGVRPSSVSWFPCELRSDVDVFPTTEPKAHVSGQPS